MSLSFTAQVPFTLKYLSPMSAAKYLESKCLELTASSALNQEWPRLGFDFAERVSPRLAGNLDTATSRDAHCQQAADKTFITTIR
jgi:hypothetical protein